MPSEEMLRKLLDEFVEKEALMLEELKVVGEQIEQLEERLIGCKERLGTIGADRQKVLGMKDRYVDGNFEIAAAPPANGNHARTESGSQSSSAAAATAINPNPTPSATAEPAASSASVSDSTVRPTSGLSAILGARSSKSESKVRMQASTPAPSANSPTISAPTPVATPPAPAPPEPVYIPPAPQPAEPLYAEPAPIDYSHEHVPLPDEAVEIPVPQSEQPATEAHQEVAAEPSDDPVVALDATQEPQEDDTVKSINDALRSLFR